MSWFPGIPLLALALLFPAAANATTWKERCQSGRFICVDVAVTDNGATASVVLPDVIYVGPGVKVVWRLPIGFAYVTGAGDGVVVQTSAGEVTSASPIDDDEADASTLTMRYRIKIATKLVNGPYKYNLQFHEMNGGNATKTVKCDPTIADVGNFTSPMYKRAKAKAARPADSTLSCSIS